MGYIGISVKMGALKTRDWKSWDHIAGVENAALENTGTN